MSKSQIHPSPATLPPSPPQSPPSSVSPHQRRISVPLPLTPERTPSRSGSSTEKITPPDSGVTHLAGDLYQKRQRQKYRDVLDSRLGKYRHGVPILEDFQLMKVLGVGVAGKVLLVRHTPTASVHAMKAISKRSVLAHNELLHTLTEVNVMKRFAVEEPDNKFITKLNWSFTDQENFYFVMDFYPGGDLATQLELHGILGHHRTRFYAADIVQGLEDLHRHGIVVRDLKPENILLNARGHAVLADFGFAKEFGYRGEPRPVSVMVDPGHAPPPTWAGAGIGSVRKTREGTKRLTVDRANTFVGTSEYLAPEVVSRAEYTYAVDWWALGVILCEALTGRVPFKKDDDDPPIFLWNQILYHRWDALFDTEARTFDLEDDFGIDPITIGFLDGLLQKDPMHRLTEPCIKQHPYFVNIDWDTVKEGAYNDPHGLDLYNTLERNLDYFPRLCLDENPSVDMRHHHEKHDITATPGDPDREESTELTPLNDNDTYAWAQAKVKKELEGFTWAREDFVPGERWGGIAVEDIVRLEDGNFSPKQSRAPGSDYGSDYGKSLDGSLSGDEGSLRHESVGPAIKIQYDNPVDSAEDSDGDSLSPISGSGDLAPQPADMDDTTMESDTLAAEADGVSPVVQIDTPQTLSHLGTPTPKAMAIPLPPSPSPPPPLSPAISSRGRGLATTPRPIPTPQPPMVLEHSDRFRPQLRLPPGLPNSKLSASDVVSIPSSPGYSTSTRDRIIRRHIPHPSSDTIPIARLSIDLHGTITQLGDTDDDWEQLEAELSMPSIPNTLPPPSSFFTRRRGLGLGFGQVLRKRPSILGSSGLRRQAKSSASKDAHHHQQGSTSARASPTFSNSASASASASETASAGSASPTKQRQLFSVKSIENTKKAFDKLKVLPRIRKSHGSYATSDTPTPQIPDLDAVCRSSPPVLMPGAFQRRHTEAQDQPQRGTHSLGLLPKFSRSVSSRLLSPHPPASSRSISASSLGPNSSSKRSPPLRMLGTFAFETPSPSDELEGLGAGAPKVELTRTPPVDWDLDGHVRQG